MGQARLVPIDGAELQRRARALERALGDGGAQLPQADVERARAITTKVRERSALTGGRTIVALAGATGSGKSSLFNAIVGAPVAAIGVLRPTTSTPTAASWGSAPVGDLLDWLGVGQRHTVIGPDEAGQPLDGLVLLDLPDLDSRDIGHHEEAERILALVDVFVWVTDPQKYADARLHDDYIAALATHDAVTVVVLNQLDRLSPAQLDECRADLSRLLARDGLTTVQVLATSARTGAGVDELRHRLATAVAGANAARARLAADVASVAGALAVGLGPGEPAASPATEHELVDALCVAVGVPTVTRAVERDYIHAAIERTGWPFTRWVRALRPNPLRRLRLDESRVAPDVTDADVREIVGRSSLPPPTPSARAAVSLATRRVADQSSEQLPPAWADAVADAARPDRADLADALDRAVMTTSLRFRTPLWWRVLGALQAILAAVAVVGLVWLAVLGAFGWLRLPQPSTPSLAAVPVPTLMVGAGLLLGILLALLSRWWARVGARRRAASASRRLRESVTGVAATHVFAPVEAVLARHARVRSDLATARGTGP